MAVLPDLGDEDARAPAVILLEVFACGDDVPHLFVHQPDLLAVNPRNGPRLSAMAAENLLHRHRDFADGRLGAGGVH